MDRRTVWITEKLLQLQLPKTCSTMMMMRLSGVDLLRKVFTTDL
jgi:hypothetical protein